MRGQLDSFSAYELPKSSLTQPADGPDTPLHSLPIGLRSFDDGRASRSIGGRFGFYAVLAPQGPEGAPCTGALPLSRSTRAVMIRFSSPFMVKSFSRLGPRSG